MPNTKSRVISSRRGMNLFESTLLGSNVHVGDSAVKPVALSPIYSMAAHADGVWLATGMKVLDLEFPITD